MRYRQLNNPTCDGIRIGRRDEIENAGVATTIFSLDIFGTMKFAQREFGTRENLLC